MTDYQEFIRTKRNEYEGVGFEPIKFTAPLFNFQEDIVSWACRKGRCAVFADCGMGKTIMQLEWASQVVAKTGGRVLILAPLAVATQTVEEGKRFGIEINHSRDGSILDGITITNYEMLKHFDASKYEGVVLDESSILKNYSGKVRNQIVSAFCETSYRLACTATPAPNDHMELGSHSEFLGVMSSSEMLSAFFINDAANVGRYRIKGHAQRPFFQWMSNWSVMIRKPSDMGYDDGKFTLPELVIHEHVVECSKVPEGFLFAMDAHTLGERQAARRNSVEDRVNAVVEIVNEQKGPVLIWCDRNDESDMLTKSITDAVEVKGSMKPKDKEAGLLGFTNGTHRILVSKPSIAGWGMNWQHCNCMIFTGLSDSYEQYYQAVRRCWRFGQTKPVHCHVVTTRSEGAVVANIKRKEAQSLVLSNGMADQMADIHGDKGDSGFIAKYKSEKIKTPTWMATV